MSQHCYVYVKGEKFAYTVAMSPDAVRAALIGPPDAAGFIELDGVSWAVESSDDFQSESFYSAQVLRVRPSEVGSYVSVGPRGEQRIAMARGLIDVT